MHYSKPIATKYFIYKSSKQIKNKQKINYFQNQNSFNNARLFYLSNKNLIKLL